MKINEYAANVSEYTEVVDAPYNHKGNNQELDERPMGFIKGGLQKLGAKLLPGSYGARMQGKVETGQQANQLYKEFNIFLGKSGYQSTDDAVRAFIQQKNLNVNIDAILKQVAPVAESLDRILVLSGQNPKKSINEAVALSRGLLNKVFMQVAQQLSGGDKGEPASSSDTPPSGGGGYYSGGRDALPPPSSTSAPPVSPPTPSSTSAPPPPSSTSAPPPPSSTSASPVSPPTPSSTSAPPPPSSTSASPTPTDAPPVSTGGKRSRKAPPLPGSGTTPAPRKRIKGPQGRVAQKAADINTSLGQGAGFRYNFPQAGDPKATVVPPASAPAPVPTKRKRKIPPPPPTTEDIQLDRLLSKISKKL